MKATFGFFILCGLVCVVFQCEGKINRLPNGNNLTFVKGSNGKISWSFDDSIDSVKYRSWTFRRKKTDKAESIAEIVKKANVNIEKKWLTRVEIEGDAALILKDVDASFSGMYTFSLSAPDPLKSEVTVFIAVPPENVRAVFSAKMAEVDESFTITCEAYADPPPKFSIFYNNTRLIGREKTYMIPKVNSSHSGFYKCGVENGFGSRNSTSVYLHVVGTDKTSEKGGDSGLGLGAIIGIVIGVLVLLVIVIGIIWFKFKHKDKDHGNECSTDRNRTKKQTGSTSNHPPHEYATLEPPQTVTYAALDKKDLKKGGPEKPARTHTPTEYADIQVS